MLNLIIYTTLGCHLCEQALDIVHLAGQKARPVEIANDESLVERYGIRIPVIKHAESNAEIGWPFDIDVFNQWLATLPCK